METTIAALLLVDAQGKVVASNQAVERIRRGSGQVTLVDTFTVPQDATRIDVMVGLAAPGSSVMSSYPVQ